MSDTLVTLRGEVAEWANETFPNANHDSICAHLMEEVGELAESFNEFEIEEEIGDCLLLLFHICDLYGIDPEAAARKKFEVVKKRQWGKPDERGVIRHVKENP